MAQEYAKAFYRSQEWLRARKAYIKSVGGLCEDCLAKGLYVPGKVVHHRTHLSPDNINDEAIRTGFDNLKLVCQDCHAKEHHPDCKRYRVSADGSIEQL